MDSSELLVSLSLPDLEPDFREKARYPIPGPALAKGLFGWELCLVAVGRWLWRLATLKRLSAATKTMAGEALEPKLPLKADSRKFQTPNQPLATGMPCPTSGAVTLSGCPAFLAMHSSRRGSDRPFPSGHRLGSQKYRSWARHTRLCLLLPRSSVRLNQAPRFGLTHWTTAWYSFLKRDYQPPQCLLTEPHGNGQPSPRDTLNP